MGPKTREHIGSSPLGLIPGALLLERWKEGHVASWLFWTNEGYYIHV